MLSDHRLLGQYNSRQVHFTLQTSNLLADFMPPSRSPEDWLWPMQVQPILSPMRRERKGRGKTFLPAGRQVFPFQPLRGSMEAYPTVSSPSAVTKTGGTS